MEIIRHRPHLREVNGKDRPKPLDMHIKSVDNGYVLSVGWLGGQQTLIAHTLADVVEWLNNWDGMNKHE
jgi:hypothetical protein